MRRLCSDGCVKLKEEVAFYLEFSKAVCEMMFSLIWRLLSWRFLSWQVTTWAIYSRELSSLMLVMNPVVVVLSTDFRMGAELCWDVKLLV